MKTKQEQWREEFEEYDKTTLIIEMHDYDIREMYYLAAREKAQEEIDSLKKYNPLSPSERQLMAEIEKRDRLLEITLPHMKDFIETSPNNGGLMAQAKQWLKDYEELK
jgi:diadenosine tetraphosphatase ApaH/serine/threonine PP2A family protein phosphatase